MRWIVSCLVGLTAVAYLAQGREMEDGRIFAARSVKTAIIVTTSTTVTPLTCAAVLPANTVCQRRRYRSFSLIDLKKKEGFLHSSLLETIEDETPNEGKIREVVDNDDDDEKEEGAAGSEGLKRGRIALTLWTTTSTTFTVTSTSINSSTTFSLSFFCNVGGASFPPPCG